MRAALPLFLLIGCTTDLTIQALNVEPDILIESPTDGATLRPADAMALVATVTDFETSSEDLIVTWGVEDPLTGTLTWSNDEATLALDDPLPPGTIDLVASVTDAAGATSTDQITVTILGDADQDGFLSIDDCNDADPLIFPGAPERCNGVDDDCDDEIDEDPEEFPPQYVDNDGDGYGTTPIAASSCDLAPGAAWLDGDCRDGDPTIHPGAPEQCDNADNDCDGLRDEDLPVVPDHYPDVQSAVDASPDGASICVQHGTYPAVDFGAREVTVVGMSSNIRLDGSGVGPAMRFEGNGTDPVTHVINIDTTNTLGHAIQVIDASPHLADLHIRNSLCNTPTCEGVSIHVQGGSATFVGVDFDVPSLTDPSTVRGGIAYFNNWTGTASDFWAGGFDLLNGADMVEGLYVHVANSQATMRDIVLWYGIVDTGSRTAGMLYADDSTLVLERPTIVGAYAGTDTIDGLSLYAENSDVTVTNGSFSIARARDCTTCNGVVTAGAGTSMSLTNTDIVYNEVDSETDVACAGTLATMGDGLLTVRNTHVVGNTSTCGPTAASGHVAFSYSNLYDNAAPAVTSSVSQLNGMTADPLFVNAGAGVWYGYYDLRLQPTSPSIDSGDPALLDVDGTRSNIGSLGGPGGQ